MLFAEVVRRVRRAARIVFFSITLGCASVCTDATAANVALAWNPSTDPTVSGYRLYYGLAGATYTNMVDTGPATSVTVSNLVPGTTYQFAATTYTVAGIESALSAEVSYTVSAVGQDYLGAGVGTTSVQSGRAATLPVYLTCSEGITNVIFTVGWPGSKFPNPSLSNVISGVTSNFLKNQSTNLVINFQAPPGQALQGSNLIAQLNFRTISNQPSAFVNLPVAIISGMKPNGTGYSNCFAYAGRVVVVNNQPLVQASPSTGSSLTLTVFGKVGAKYQLQSATNLAAPVIWSPLSTYSQSNIMQTLSVNPTSPVLMYRVQQQ